MIPSLGSMLMGGGDHSIPGLLPSGSIPGIIASGSEAGSADPPSCRPWSLRQDQHVGTDIPAKSVRHEHVFPRWASFKANLSIPKMPSMLMRGGDRSIPGLLPSGSIPGIIASGSEAEGADPPSSRAWSLRQHKNAGTDIPAKSVRQEYLPPRGAAFKVNLSIPKMPSLFKPARRATRKVIPSCLQRKRGERVMTWQEQMLLRRTDKPGVMFKQRDRKVIPLVKFDEVESQLYSELLKEVGPSPQESHELSLFQSLMWLFLMYVALYHDIEWI